MRHAVHLSTHFDSKELIVKFRDLLILAGGVAAATQSGALSLGNTQGSVQLGAPIDLVFQVQPDAGQTPDNSCIAADIWMGDTALGSNSVVLTTQAKTVRVRSTQPVYEPLVTVKLRAGCSAAVSRSYTFFADPPSSMAASVEPIDLSKIEVAALPVQAEPRRPATTARAAADAKPRTPKRPVTSAKAPAKPAAATNAESAAPAAAAATATAAAAVAAAPSAPATTTPTAPPPPAAPAADNAEKPKLRVEPLGGLNAAEGAAGTGAEPQATTGSAIEHNTQTVLDANAARLESMEKQLKALQAQLSSNRNEINSLQTQLVQAQNQELPLWVYLMLGMLALALASIAWLLQRLQQERQKTQRSWADTVLAMEDTAQATSVDTAPQPLAVPVVNTPAQPVPPAATATAPSSASTTDLPTAPQAVPQYPNAKESAPNTLLADDLYAEFEQLVTAPPAAAAPAPQIPSPSSITEVLTAQALFDVQEQADFYASIGENDQAIEILQTHIAEHESSSPLAYMELLQLLYRLGRTDTFEQVRDKFQNHFNVKVPDFLGFARKGMDLWSGYPEALGKIEAIWPTDDVQALLRSLIVRQPSSEFVIQDVRFDLAAFDDLLMLYNVAQTTPAASRGQMPGRTRTAPTEAPLPEVVLDLPGTRPTPAAAAMERPLPLHAAQLDMLSAAPATAPLAPAQSLNDSPFQGPSHFAPNEALVDGLSLDWNASLAPASATPEKLPDVPPPAPISLDNLDAELAAFMMDERDLPKQPPKAS